MYPGLFLERVWKEKPRKVTTSGRKRRSMRKIERHVNLIWSGWPITNGWIKMTATTSWHAKYGRWWWWWLLWRLAWWSWKLGLHTMYMNIQENKILHLNCVNFFWSSKKWFDPVKVLPLLLDQMSSEVQGTFGMTLISDSSTKSSRQDNHMCFVMHPIHTQRINVYPWHDP